MDAKLFLKKRQDTKLQKSISSTDAVNFIKKIESETNWEIRRLIKDIQSKKADSFSINKDKPRSSLFVGNGSKKISIKLRTEKVEAKISIPKDIDID